MKNLILTVALVLVAIPALAQPSKPINPCSLVTKAEVQEAVGAAKVADPAVNQSMPGACDFAVGEAGSVSIGTAPPSEMTQFEAQAKTLSIKLTPAPNIGDRAFFADVSGIQQVHVLKGKRYVVATVSVPGLNDQKNRDVAVKVIQKALSRL